MKNSRQSTFERVYIIISTISCAIAVTLYFSNYFLHFIPKNGDNQIVEDTVKEHKSRLDYNWKKQPIEIEKKYIKKKITRSDSIKVDTVLGELFPKSITSPKKIERISSIEFFFERYRTFLLVLVMILGMLFNQFYEILLKFQHTGEEINFKLFFKKVFRGIGFWIALTVSPLVFFSTYTLISQIPDAKLAYFYAFQNGFFWLQIFGKLDGARRTDNVTKDDLMTNRKDITA